MKQPRVLIVTTEAPDVLYGGLGFFLEVMSNELIRRNYPFKTVYLHLYKTKASEWADYNVSTESLIPFDASPESSSLSKAWSTRVKLNKILCDYNPDIISIHEPWAAMPFIFDMEMVQFTWHPSHVGMEHYLAKTVLGLQNYWEQRIAVQRCSSLVMHSNWVIEEIRKHVADDFVAPDIFPIGLKIEDYQSEKIRHPKGKIVFGFFGRFLDLAKNFNSIRVAWSNLPQNYKDKIEFRVYGPDRPPEVLIEEGFSGLTFVQGEEKKRAYAETDVVFMPSIKESFGIVGLEALMSNCKLIATGGLGSDMYLPLDMICLPHADALMKRMMQEVDLIDETRKLQENNYFRQLVSKSDFSSVVMVDRYIDVWRRMLEKMQR